MPDRKPTKLQLNPDGTVTVPIKDGDAIEVEEPSARQLATVHTLFYEADRSRGALPDLKPQPLLGPNPKAADLRKYEGELTAYVESVKARVDAMTTQDVLQYGNVDESPYLQAWIKALDVLAGASVDPDGLYAWAMNPVSAKRLLDHFTAPLGGADQEAPGDDD